MNTTLIAGEALFIIPLALMAYSDHKNLSVARLDSYGLLAFMVIAIGIIFWADPYAEILQMVVGSAIFIIMRKQARRLYADLDQQVFYLAMIANTIPALAALVAMNLYIMLKAAMKTDKKIYYPALVRFALVFIPLSLLSVSVF